MEINTTKIKTNLNAIKYHIGFWVALVFQVQVLFRQDIFSTKFISTFVNMTFIALTLNITLYSVLFLVFRRKEFYRPAFLTLFLSNIAIMVAITNESLYSKLSNLMNAILVTPFFQAKFVSVSLRDSNLFWTLMLSIYLGMFLLIYGNWFVRHKKWKDGFWKIERQVMYTGIGVYGVLTIFVFIFTHFTFVGTNFMYAQNAVQYIDKISEHYEEIGEKNNFALRDLKYFESVKDILKFYEAPIYKSRNLTGPDKEDFYEGAIHILKGLDMYGFRETQPIKYDNLKSFNDWVQISYNFNIRKTSQKYQKLWYTEITPTVLSSDKAHEEVLRHSVLYVKKSKEGGYYTYFSFDRTFKDHHMNYIFNLFFVMFHIFYIGFFAYLLSIHQKKNLNRKYKNVEEDNKNE